MSWSIQFIGKPEKVAEALTAQSVKMSGDSKLEYVCALPHLVGLVNENYGPNVPLIKIIAAGHGYANGANSNRQLTASVEIVYGVLV
jgi:carbon monoxide dehydrogenase subunit G